LCYLSSSSPFENSLENNSYSFFVTTDVECSVFVLSVPGAAVLPSGLTVGSVVCVVSVLAVVCSEEVVTGAGALVG